MTTDHRLNGVLFAATGSGLTLFFAGLLGVLTVILFNDLSPTGIGPVTAACSYLLGCIFLALSIVLVRTGVRQIKYRRRDFAVVHLTQQLIPAIVGLGAITPVFCIFFHI